MARPSLGRQARTVTATVKVTEAEALALAAEHGSVGRGLRALLDGVVPSRGASPRCRIHRNYSEPQVSNLNGVRTITKTCQDCGYVSVTSTSAGA